MTFTKSFFPFILGVLSLTMLTTACKTKQKVQTGNTPTTQTDPKTTPPPPLSIRDIVNGMEANALNAEWVATDAALNYEGKPMNIAASSTWRYRKDSVIWVSVKKFGFGVARVLVRRDSIFVLNMVQSQYMAKDFQFIEKTIGIPANFELVQDLLIGKPVFLTNPDLLDIKKSPEGDLILRGDNTNGSLSKNGNWVATYRLNPTNFQIKDMIFEQPNIGRSLKIIYDGYKPLNGANFAFSRRIEATSLETGKVMIEFDMDETTVEINVPKNVRFEIPSSYQKVD
jgi:Domain of unknown function (DUF4292)